MNYVNDEILSKTLSGQANHESGETLHVYIMWLSDVWNAIRLE
jgi:hypothetical protein